MHPVAPAQAMDSRRLPVGSGACAACHVPYERHPGAFDGDGRPRGSALVVALLFGALKQPT